MPNIGFTRNTREGLDALDAQYGDGDSPTPQPKVEGKLMGGDQAPFDTRKTKVGPQGKRMTPEEYRKMMAAVKKLRSR